MQAKSHKVAIDSERRCSREPILVTPTDCNCKSEVSLLRSQLGRRTSMEASCRENEPTGEPRTDSTEGQASELRIPWRAAIMDKATETLARVKLPNLSTESTVVNPTSYNYKPEIQRQNRKCI
ncbi:unnamed protein product [Cercospora beticola]|nr:unnamed protein product [Cercospora beticola]